MAQHNKLEYVALLKHKPPKLPMHQTFTLVSSYIKSHKNKQQAENLVDAFEPSESIIEGILNYSKSLSIKKSKYIDFIEFVGN